MTEYTYTVDRDVLLTIGRELLRALRVDHQSGVRTRMEEHEEMLTGKKGYRAIIELSGQTIDPGVMAALSERGYRARILSLGEPQLLLGFPEDVIDFYEEYVEKEGVPEAPETPRPSKPEVGRPFIDPQPRWEDTERLPHPR